MLVLSINCTFFYFREGLYRGLEPVLVSLCASNFVYFYSFHGLRSVFNKKGSNQSAARDLLLGSIAGAINVLLTTPLWVVNMRMKMQGAKVKITTFSLYLNGDYFTG